MIRPKPSIEPPAEPGKKAKSGDEDKEKEKEALKAQEAYELSLEEKM